MLWGWAEHNVALLESHDSQRMLIYITDIIKDIIKTLEMPCISKNFNPVYFDTKFYCGINYSHFMLIDTA